MSRAQPETRRRGRPSTTSRAEIVAAARRLIEDEGAERLTLRRLATAMGVGPSTLYRHVRDREDLLVLVLDDFLQQVPLPDLPRAPRERVVVAAVAMRDALASRPWAADVLAVDGFLGRLDDASVRLVEVVLAAAVEAGCSSEQAVDLFRALWSHCVGEVLIRARSRTTTREERARYPGFASRDPRLLPRLAEIGTRWPHIAARDTYAAGVRALVDGMLPRPADGA
ncbi:helix-turn-helix domain-containing protein [Isoptericola sp. G70]|uniref:TetR/AcrR family transcriptional regulator n=1 Tax=Isoptericola sp. G70 TaxID=3376633 RepID=UPI003A80B7C1